MCVSGGYSRTTVGKWHKGWRRFQFSHTGGLRPIAIYSNIYDTPAQEYVSPVSDLRAIRHQLRLSNVDGGIHVNMGSVPDYHHRRDGFAEVEAGGVVHVHTHKPGGKVSGFLCSKLRVTKLWVRRGMVMKVKKRLKGTGTKVLLAR